MFRQKIYEIIKDDEKTGIGRVFDIFMTILIILNVISIIADTFSSLPQWFPGASRILEIFSVIIFTIEYAMRIITADIHYPELSPIRARGKFVLSGYAIIDLLAILPFYIPSTGLDLRVLRVIRLIRILRVFKLGRYSEAMSIIGRVLKRAAPQLFTSITVVGLLMVVSSVLMYYVESPAQPEKFANAMSGFWWAIATLTTVGYGDIYPITIMGKVISAIIALLGIGIVAVPTGIVSAGFMHEMTHGRAEPPDPL